MRELKFKSWDDESKVMHPGFTLPELATILSNPIDQGMGAMKMFYAKDKLVWLQYTGLKDKNGKEIYEGDIFRIEENATEADEVDRIFYVVITWVQEWCMFCSLLVDSEYFDYKNDGIKGLDEPMFWTYTLEDTNSRKHFLCGNIYEQPHLLKPDEVRELIKK